MVVETHRKTIKDFGKLSPAEHKLIRNCPSGEPTHIDTNLPTRDREIRASLVRHLMLGGCAAAKPPIEGVVVYGAIIKGTLSLVGCKSRLRLILTQCDFEEGLRLNNSHIEALVLNGSKVPSIKATNMKVDGSISLTNGFTSFGSLSFASSTIGGQFSFRSAHILRNGIALNCQNITVSGGVILRKANFKNGHVRFNGAKIGGNFDCRGAVFSSNSENALSLQSAKIQKALIWKHIKAFTGKVDLRHTFADVLSDEIDCWLDLHFQIDGLKYDVILDAQVDAEPRLKWLIKQDGENFSPQPYEQLARVLGSMGHRRDRAHVLEEMERLIRSDIRKRPTNAQDEDWLFGERGIFAGGKRNFQKLSDHSLHWLIGFGYRPARSIIAAVIVIALTWALSAAAWHKGDMVPNSDIILTSQSWQGFAADREKNAAEDWTKETDVGRDYATFYAGAYAADVFIPLIDFGQEEAWSPSTERGWWGVWLYWLSWFIKALGWIITALGAAAVTGIIRQER